MLCARLHPTHVIVNVDENDLATFEKISGIRAASVIVTHPNAPADNIALYRLLGRVFNAEEHAEQLVAELQRELDACTTTAWSPSECCI